MSISIRQNATQQLIYMLYLLGHRTTPPTHIMCQGRRYSCQAAGFQMLWQCAWKFEVDMRRTEDGHDQVEVVVAVRGEGERPQVRRRDPDAQLLVQFPAQRALRRLSRLQLRGSGSRALGWQLTGNGSLFPTRSSTPSQALTRLAEPRLCSSTPKQCISGSNMARTATCPAEPHLAARELPQAGQGAPLGPLRQEHLAAVVDEGHGRHEHGLDRRTRHRRGHL